MVVFISGTVLFLRVILLGGTLLDCDVVGDVQKEAAKGCDATREVDRMLPRSQRTQQQVISGINCAGINADRQKAEEIICWEAEGERIR